jgi:hypothetical protein
VQVLKSKLRDWVNSPVVEIVKTVLERELSKAYEDRAKFFLSGEPIKTQEVRANYMGRELILEDMISLLELDEDILSEYFELNEVKVIDDTEQAIDE